MLELGSKLKIADVDTKRATTIELDKIFNPVQWLQLNA